ncbi:hypothetical protein SAMN05660733_03919 [Lentzea albidocapillata]|uniref:Uncharacterized protein n=2 Tax=Lentzea albidocapillata TaxID=40571 RepID=A0A1W2ED12_9PSEU|nr:hypothetical protein SAMN05660733_03919 [Lentzea albidocapillata]
MREQARIGREEAGLNDSTEHFGGATRSSEWTTHEEWAVFVAGAKDGDYDL